MLARPPALCFFREFLCFRFSRSLKAIKRHRAWFLLSFAVVNIIKTIFVIMKLRFHKGRRSPAIIWLCFWFSSICFDKISQNFENLRKLFFRLLTSRKKGVAEAVSSLFCKRSSFQMKPWSWKYLRHTVRETVIVINSTYLMLRLSTGKRTLWRSTDKARTVYLKWFLPVCLLNVRPKLKWGHVYKTKQWVYCYSISVF